MGRDKAKKYFNCTKKERALFEAGIKLGTIYHQYIGVPVTIRNVALLEKAMEKGITNQPFVKNVKVRIDRAMLREKKDQYDYITLEPKMLSVELEIDYMGAKAKCMLKYIKEMKYPLMFVKKVW
ncbi:MAG: dihydroneopterin aldolase family protein [Candidatus Thermoplasmatota archaeon]